MKFTVKETVRGISNMEYDIDGKKVLSFAAHVDVELDPDKGGKGMRTEPKRCKEPEVVKSIAHNPFPMIAEIDYQQLAGKKQGQVDLVILAIRPIQTVAEPIKKAA
jgi:hypothetical protein